MATEYSIQKMVSDGTLSTIALGIQYLQRNDIYIRIAGEETPQSGAPSGYTWSFISNTTLKILPVVPNGVEVVVYRRTDVDAMYNIYSQNAQFDEATIDENNQQLLYIAQEYLEQGLPGAGIEGVEYINTVGGINYYRFKLSDGAYTPPFGVPDGTDVLRGELGSSTGSAIVGFQQIGNGAVPRTAQSKMQEGISVIDFGGVGGGVVDNSSVFATIDADSVAKKVDLVEREYLVIHMPRGNKYHDGVLVIPSTMQYTGAPLSYNKKIVPFHTPNHNAAPSLNVVRDANFRTVRMMRSTEKNTDGGNRIFQDLCFDERARQMFVLCRSIDGTQSNVGLYSTDNGVFDVTVLRSSAYTDLLHGSGLSLQYNEDGTNWLWGSGRNTIAIPNGGRDVVRFQFPATDGAAISNVTRYRVLSADIDGYAGNETTPEVSRCGRYMAVFGRINTKRLIVRIFDMRIFDGAADGADFSRQYLYEWEPEQDLLADNSFNEPQPKQGMTCDGTYVYIIAGSSRKETPKHIHVYTLDGKLVAKHNAIDAQASSANAFHEPQGLTTCSLGGDLSSFSLVFNTVGNNSSLPGYKANTLVAICNLPALFRSGNNNGIGVQTPQCRHHVSNTGFPTPVVGVPGGTLGLYQNSGSTSFVGVLASGALGFTHELMLGSPEVPREGRVSYSSDAGDGSYQLSFWAKNTKLFAADITAAGDFSLLRSGPTGNMGTAGTPWGTAYFQVAPVIVSDANYKEQIFELDEREKRVAIACKSLVRKYKLKESVVEKGADARWHVGVIAQDVAEAFRGEGLDPFGYGIVCYDEWEEQPEVQEVHEVLDEDGNVVVPYVAHRPYIAAGSKYQIRYDELMCFIISVI